MLEIKRKQISVIILNFNGKKYLEKCLRSLKRQTYDDAEVILVDNASIDGSVKYVKENFPWVEIVENGKNVGFAEGNNVGATYANGDYFVFLNCDTEVDPRWLETLIKVMESFPNVAICGSKILDMTQRKIIQEVGGLCDAYGFSLSRGWGEIDRHQYNKIIETFYVSGASLLIKREISDRIGLFDSKYFFNQEDVDICWRAQIAGYKVIVNPESVVYHKGGGSAQSALGASVDGERRCAMYAWRRYYAERNILRTILKNYSLLTLAKLLPMYFFMYSLEVVFYLITGKSMIALAYVRAFLWNIENIKNTWYNHREVQKLRKVSDNEVRKKMIKGSGKFFRFRQIGSHQFK